MGDWGFCEHKWRIVVHVDVIFKTHSILSSDATS